jgi:hypothetical protein
MIRRVLILVVGLLGISIACTGIRNANATPATPIGGLDTTPTASSDCKVGVNHSSLLNVCSVGHLYVGYDWYRDGDARAYARGYRQGYYRGRYDATYPYVRYYSGRGLFVDQGGCPFGSYPVCNGVVCWRLCY